MFNGVQSFTNGDGEERSPKVQLNSDLIWFNSKLKIVTSILKDSEG